MSVHEADLRALPAIEDPAVRREGWVWSPPSAGSDADGAIRSTPSRPGAG